MAVTPVLEIACVCINSCMTLAPTRASADNPAWDIYPFKDGGYDMRKREDIEEMMQDLANLQHGIEERIEIVSI